MKLWEPEMCCCFKLRTGTLIIASLFLICGCIGFIGGVHSLAYGYTAVQTVCHEEHDDYEDFEDCVKLEWKIELGASISSVVIACFHIVFSILLIHGVVKQKTLYFVPLMISYMVQICIMIIASILIIIVLIILEVPFAVSLIIAAILGLYIFMETYFLLVIRAHYLEIKRAKGRMHMTLNDKGDFEAMHEGVDAPPPYWSTGNGSN